MANPVYATPSYRRDRARILADQPMCAICRCRVATEADHDPPLKLHQHTDGTDCCTLRPSCATCARRQGAILSGYRMARPAPIAPPTSRVPAAPAPVPDPVGYDQTDPVWDVDWLDDLRDVPADATWPRLMTRPHPRAVGSYGDRFVAWCAARDVHLRWWQRLAATRLLEYDGEHMLVWRSAFVSTARQVGKSLLLRQLCSWRLDEAGRLFTPEQLILHTARKLTVAAEIQRPARRLAKLSDRYKVLEVAGGQQIERLDDGSRWMVRAKDNVVSLTVDLAVVDEVWDVSSALVETDLIPTMMERPNAQLVMWSTAHRKATSLVLTRRRALDVANPASALHVEWSAPADVDLDDRAGWRQASPHWTPQREELVADRLAAARSGQTDDPDEPDPEAAFTSQYLNRWPARIETTDKGERLLPDVAWAALTSALTGTVGAGHVAIEDYWGKGAAAAYAVSDGAGRFEVGGEACDNWDDAVGLARQFVTARPGARLVVGANMRTRVPADFPGVSAMRVAGQTETHRALPLLRALVDAGQVVHDPNADGAAALAEQIDAARVKPMPSGGLTFATTARSDLLRAMLWALDAAQVTPPTPAIR